MTEYSGKDNLQAMKYALNYNLFIIDKISSIIKKFNYEKILDFGCGDGYFLQTIKNKYNNKNIYGVEIDDFFLKEAIKNNLNVFNSIDEFQNNSIDFIYSLQVLEHIQDDLQCLKKMYQKLRTEGRIFICVPAIQFLYSSMDKKVGHFRRYNKKQLNNLVTQAGFIIEKSLYIDSFAILGKIIYKFTNKNGSITSDTVHFYDKFFFPTSRLLDILFFEKLIGNNLYVQAKKNN